MQRKEQSLVIDALVLVVLMAAIWFVLAVSDDIDRGWYNSLTNTGTGWYDDGERNPA